MKMLVAVFALTAFVPNGTALAAEAAAKPAAPGPTSTTPTAKPTTPPTTKKPEAAAGSKPAPAQLGMSVSGTQESPKVLYIVPWKTVDAVPAEPYVSGLLDEVFAPVDPVEFERSVHQHQQLQTPAEAGVGP